MLLKLSKSRMSRTFLITALLLTLMSCNPDGSQSGASGLQVHTYDQMNMETDGLNSHAGVTGRSSLAFIGGTYVRLGKSDTPSEGANDVGVVYPRFVKTSQGDWLMFYHYVNTSTPAGNKCAYMRSADLQNWTFEKMLFSPVTFTSKEDGKEYTRVYAGADLLSLPDGRIMAVAATRRLTDYQRHSIDNGLAVRYSSDGGRTWTDDQFIGVGSVWEPKPLLLSDGTIQIYYTDSDIIYDDVWSISINNSGTSYVYSADNGKTWEYKDAAGNHFPAFRQVFQKNGTTVLYTDQMPAVTLINGTDMIAAAAESDVASDITKDEYMISLAYTDENGSWGVPDAEGVIPADRSDDMFKGCAPYIMQFPSGETVLSYNCSGIFYYRMGNEKARGFGNESRVFDWNADVGKGFWGTVVAADDHVLLAAVGGGSVKEGDPDDGNWKMELGRFYLNHNISAPQEGITVDGNNSEWKGTEALFVGSGKIRTAAGKAAQSVLRAANDAENLYLTVDAVGNHITEINFSSGYLTVDSSGLLMSSFMDVKVASQKGITSKGENGYVTEISIPLKTFGRNPKSVPVRIAASDGTLRDLMASDYASTWPCIQIR